MNNENLQKAIDYLEADYDDINERFHLKDSIQSREDHTAIMLCNNSVGSLIGHLTAIDADNVNDNFKDEDGNVSFIRWSYTFFDIDEYDWYFMFDSDWAFIPESNTLRQGINRMKYMLKHQQPPEDWEYGDTYE